MKKPRSFRIEVELLEEAAKKKININKVVESAIAKAVGDNRCPYCGSKRKGKK